MDNITERVENVVPHVIIKNCIPICESENHVITYQIKLFKEIDGCVRRDKITQWINPASVLAMIIDTCPKMPSPFDVTI